MENETLDIPNLNPKSKEILEINNEAIKLITEENVESAIELLKEAEKKIAKNESEINDPKIKIIINHNLACSYQKIKNIPKCIAHLEKVNSDFDMFLESKHKIKISPDFFLQKILSDNPQPNVLLGDFILELRFCAKFHLQMCAAYSQNNNHKEALVHAKLAALICEDNVSKTFFLLKQTQMELHNEKLFSKIFAEKVKENEPVIQSLYKYIIDIANHFNNSNGASNNKTVFTPDKITTFINNKVLKISTRNILGVIKNDDWLNAFNIGNIMFLFPVSYDDLDLDSDPKYELLRDAIIEKILMLTVAFFSISNEVRFLNSNLSNNKNDNGSYFHSKAVEIACSFLPSTCPIIKHYVTSYGKYYGNENQMNQLDALLNPNTNLNSVNNKVNFDITKDPILNIGDKEIKIVETSNNSLGCLNHNSMSNPGMIRNESGQAKTERKREVKSALTGRSAKGSSMNHGNSRGKNNCNDDRKAVSTAVFKGEGKKSLKSGIKNNYNHLKQGIAGNVSNNNNIQNNNVNSNEIKYTTYNFNKDAFSFKKMMK